jgi:hypothetical protein
MHVIFKLFPLQSCYTNKVVQVKPIVLTTLHRLGRLVVNHFFFCVVKYTPRQEVAYLTLKTAGHEESRASWHAPFFCVVD